MENAIATVTEEAKNLQAPALKPAAKTAYAGEIFSRQMVRTITLDGKEVKLRIQVRLDRGRDGLTQVNGNIHLGANKAGFFRWLSHREEDGSVKAEALPRFFKNQNFKGSLPTGLSSIIKAAAHAAVAAWKEAKAAAE